MAGDPTASFLSAALMSVGYAAAVLMADISDLLPRGRRLQRWERTTVVAGLVFTIALGLIGLGFLAVGDLLTGVLRVGGAVAIGLGIFSVVMLTRTD